MAENTIKVWLFSQHPLLRQGIMHAFAEEKGVEVIGESQINDKIPRTIEVMPPDVAIVDIDSDPCDGLNLANRIKQVTPCTDVIILVSKIDDEQIFEAIKSQASACANKEINGEQLLSIVKSVANGERPINESLSNRPKVAAHILDKFHDMSQQQEVENLISPLTSRETEIVDYMARGYANKQIAAKLSISEQTIKNHITSILNKLDANARTEAVVKAIKRGLIPFAQEQ